MTGSQRPPIDAQKTEQFARAIVDRLRQHGHQAFWAGGCVRDRLLGVPPQDYDVATSALPDEVQAIFGPRRTLLVGAAFGVVTVLGPSRARQIEVATFRRDGTYSDGRHPDQVAFSSPLEDAQRRDFTINGMFYDPVSDELVDYVGGQVDLEQRRIRCIGDPDQRFDEDKLRMLRAARFAAVLGFVLEPDTLAAIQRRAGEIACVSAERIAIEMRKILVGRHAVRGLELVRESGLWGVILPEHATPDPAIEHRWRRTIDIHTHLAPNQNFSTALAALVWPLQESVGTTASDIVGTAARVRPDPSIVERFRQRWRLTNEESATASWMLQHLQVVQAARTLPWPQVQRVLIDPRCGELLKLTRAVLLAMDGNHVNLGDLMFCEDKLLLPREQLDPPPLVDGTDLLQAGIPAGPELGRLLTSIRDGQLTGVIRTREAAIAIARQQALDSGGRPAPREDRGIY
jgi:tRNA nucleotidyltransferase/poly(A) polymerase